MSKNIIKTIGKAGALAILSQIPIASAISTFFNEFVNSKWQERIKLWQEEVIEKFSKLDSEIEEKIRQKSNFASILATAQQGALVDIEQNKVQLYVNSVINAIKNENLDNTKIHIFLNMLQNFTSLHLIVLDFLAHPPEEGLGFKGAVQTEVRMTSATIIDLFKKYNPKISDIESLNMVLEDLHMKKLTTTGSFDIPLKFGKLEPKATGLGYEFLEFIGYK